MAGIIHFGTLVKSYVQRCRRIELSISLFSLSPSPSVYSLLLAAKMTSAQRGVPDEGHRDWA